MRLVFACALVCWTTSGHATDKPNGGRYTPSGSWSGICANGSDDWGDPMPIEITFRPRVNAMDATGTLSFQSDDKTQRKANAKLSGKKVGAQFVLRGTMTEVSDGTEWEIELHATFDGNRLTGKFLELTDPPSVMCGFNWGKDSSKPAPPTKPEPAPPPPESKPTPPPAPKAPPPPPPK